MSRSPRGLSCFLHVTSPKPDQQLFTLSSQHSATAPINNHKLFNGRFSRSNRISQHQISQKYTPAGVPTFIVTMKVHITDADLLSNAVLKDNSATDNQFH